VGASGDRASQAVESAAVRVPSSGKRVRVRSSRVKARVRVQRTMRTYRTMAPYGRPTQSPAKNLKIGARSQFYKVAAEVAQRPPRRPAPQTVEGGG
jgi:hypothetical protein